MAVAYVSGNGNANATVSSQTTAMPASIAAGDLLLSECFITDADAVLTVSGGWNIITQANLAASAGAFTVAIAWRIATGSSDAPTWNIAGGVAHAMQSNSWRFTGAYATSPIGNYDMQLKLSDTAAGNSAVNATAAASMMASFVDTLNTNQAPPVPTNYTSASLFQSAGMSERMSTRQLTNSGDSSGSTAVTLTSAAKTWNFLVELRSNTPIPVPTNFKAWLWR